MAAKGGKEGGGAAGSGISALLRKQAALYFFNAE